MTGMEMMLKSLGIDPVLIKKQVAEFGQIIVDLKSQMDRIEEGQQLLAQTIIRYRAEILAQSELTPMPNGDEHDGQPGLAKRSGDVAGAG